MDSVVNSCYYKKASVDGIIRQQQDNQPLPYSFPFTSQTGLKVTVMMSL